MLGVPRTLQLCPVPQAAQLSACLLRCVPEASVICGRRHLVHPLSTVPKGHCCPRRPNLQPARPGGDGRAAGPVMPRGAPVSPGTSWFCHSSSAASQLDGRRRSGRSKCQSCSCPAPSRTHALVGSSHCPNPAFHLPGRHPVGAGRYHRPGAADVHPTLLLPLQPEQQLALLQDSALQRAKASPDHFYCLRDLDH